MRSSADKERFAFLVLLSAVVLSACGGASAGVLFEAEIQRAESQTAAAEQAAAEDISLAAQSDSSAGSSLEALPSIVMGEAEFHASDPQTVALVSGRVQLVEFFAYWCAVCKAMAPTVHGLENMYGGQMNFIYLDRDDPATLPFQEQLGYIYQPHFFLLDGTGTVLAQWRGYVDGQELQRAILAALEN